MTQRCTPRLHATGHLLVLLVLCCCSSGVATACGEGDLRVVRLLPLVQGATDLLLDNYRPELEATIPSPLIDAHQESTTSIMVAMAWAHVAQLRARSEMLSIFRGQWENGMVPTVRYSPGFSGDFLRGTFVPGPGGWGNESAVSAGGANTSALAALPIHAEAALRIFDLSARDAEARLWLQGLFPPLFRYHDYLHGSRSDPDTGLVYSYHPWETEVAADSAVWSALLRETRERAANESWSPPPIPEEVSSAPGFPGEDAFDAALFLSECAARRGRVDRDVQRDCPFLLQDVQFNAALVRSDKALLELAGILEATRSGWQSKIYTPEQYERLKRWAAQAESGSAMVHLWNPVEGSFLSRYTSAVTSEVSLVRPSTSSSFSALLSPGVTSTQANSAVGILLSPGTLSFRCGDYPIPDVECSYNTDRSFGSGSGGDVRDGEIKEGGDATVVEVAVEGRGEEGKKRRRTGVGGVRSLQVGRTVVVGGGVRREGFREEGRRPVSGRDATGLSLRLLQDEEGSVAGDGDGRIGGDGYRRQLQPFQGRELVSGQEGAARDGRRVSVLHNFLAQRGLKRQGLPGVAVWLANSTLSLLAPDLRMCEDDIIGTITAGPNSDTSFSSNEALRVRAAEMIPVEFDSWAGGRGGGGGSGAIDDDDGAFQFRRVFDGDSGVPLPNAEGNSSSLAAAASVLLLLGDAPDGGNEFPPITHAMLFVLVAIELGVSFMVGVSCLVFSLNLVRKLREDDHSQYGGEGGGAIIDRTNTATRGGGIGGNGHGGNSGGGLGGMAATKISDGNLGRSRSPAVCDRGIGSLLTRRSASRLDAYDDSDDDDDDEYVGTAAMTTEDQRGGTDEDEDDVAWRGVGSSEGEGRNDSASSINNSIDDGYGLRVQRRRGRDDDGQRRGQYYLSLSSDNEDGGSRVVGRRRGSNADANSRWMAEPGGRGGERGGLQEIPRRRQADEVDQAPVQAAGQGGGGSGGSDSGVGLADVLRPFFRSMKFW